MKTDMIDGRIGVAAGAALLALLLALPGCAGARRAKLDSLPEQMPQLEVAQPPAPVSDGSLYTGTGGASLVGDFRARHVGDVLTVRITESSLGSSSADSRLEKDSSTRLEAPILFGYENQLSLGRDFDPSLALQAGRSQSFEGEGETTRQSSLIANLAVRVMAVGSGGRMLVAGTKQIKVNRETQRLVLAGIVRPEDVGPSNAIDSARIADLTITYGGTGDVADMTRQGWFARLLDKIWPF